MLFLKISMLLDLIGEQACSKIEMVSNFWEMMGSHQINQSSLSASTSIGCFYYLALIKTRSVQALSSELPSYQSRAKDWI